ncbi:histidyl-tRNA synthetase [Acetoanaerobium pronyense]|uniref:Histidine--tRNA ligase n=1 Tax=Acetoanaerobium pronyense TaxID=1482736 RepID=A0ABS4KIR3_9FIRM|nr:histidine--tRNA ligase [Acetoanaerobium pronyense]MBP2027635.1 histidyl-tRNA synthetase [Acetoanaerobium pronyense]
MELRRPRGTQDILPKDALKWNYIEGLFKKVCKNFSYGEMRTPAFEYTELFKRGVGDTTDIVQKEMFTFDTKSNESITLKPEGTAPVVRSFIENKVYADVQPTKIFYITPCFRYERPQAGRLRAFHQFGIEVFGSDSPAIDAEVIALAMDFFDRLGLTDKLELRINSVGNINSRKNYNSILKDFLSKDLEKLCKTCQERYEKNPMRILDCKIESCNQITKNAPLMLNHLDEESRTHFESLKENLDSLNIKYTVDPLIVRGLDYYTKTAFEIVSKDIGSQSTVCGGGRYDGLINELGGPDISGVGFGLGIERLLLTLESLNLSPWQKDGLDVFIATLGEKASLEATKILHILRKNDISCDKDYLERSIKAQFKLANKRNSRFTIVIGENEIIENKVILKDMKNSTQTEIGIQNIVDEVIRLSSAK